MKTLLFAVAGLLLLGCAQISAPPAGIPPGYEAKDYCQKDSDCVRQQKCCDCGLGEYVNAYNYNATPCGGPRCLCPIAASRGACDNNRCVAVAANPQE